MTQESKPDVSAIISAIAVTIVVLIGAAVFAALLYNAEIPHNRHGVIEKVWHDSNIYYLAVKLDNGASETWSTSPYTWGTLRENAVCDFVVKGISHFELTSATCENGAR